MKMHANARLSLKGRELLIDRVEHAGWALVAAAEAAGITTRRGSVEELADRTGVPGTATSGVGVSRSQVALPARLGQHHDSMPS
jgi:hypothetical protein